VPSGTPEAVMAQTGTGKKNYIYVNKSVTDFISGSE
jgi:hypothetical protein